MIRIKENFSRYEVDRYGNFVFNLKYYRGSSIFRSNDYWQCRLVDNEGCVHIMGIHQAVAMFHCDDYFPGCYVHHKDEDKGNNCWDNLQCMTNEEHARLHADPTYILNYIRKNGLHNKGKKMSDVFREHCRVGQIKRHQRDKVC